MSDLKLYVWEDVLCDYECGIVVVYAHSEAEAWDILEKKDEGTWWTLRCGSDSDSKCDSYGYLVEIIPMRPRVIDAPEAFVVSGGS